LSTIVSDQPANKYSSGPIRCASWCEERDGHPRETFARDQWCRSIDAPLTVSLHPPFETIDGGEAPAEARVYAAQDAGAAPYVTVVTHDDQGMNLTPTEARELARMLNHFAWVAEQDDRERNAFEIGRDYGDRQGA
jgi:hypothetical protein